MSSKPATLSLALHGVLMPGKPCLASGFILDANDSPIGPAISGWITIHPSANSPVRRGPKPKVLKKSAVLFAHICWTENDRLKKCEADQKICELFGYEDPRSVKRILADARKALPHGLIIIVPSSRVVILFCGFPQIQTIAPDAMTIAGPALDWRYPALQATYSELNLEITTATRIDLKSFIVTLTDMAIIHRKSG